MKNRLLTVIAAVTSATMLFAAAPANAERVMAVSPLTERTGSGLSGSVEFDGRPLADAVVEAYEVGARPEETRRIARDRSDARGRFRLQVAPRRDREVYLVTDGGRRSSRDLTLALGLGQAWPREVTVNELTTVATGYSLAQFMTDGTVVGKGVGLTNAMSMVRNIVDPITGRPSRFLRSAPNGEGTSTLGTLRTLGDALASCRSDRDCREVLKNTTTSRRGLPANTFQAMANLASDPMLNTRAIHRLAARGPYGRTAREPESWVIALLFQGTGRQFRGPGNFLFDADGNVWITNNYVPARDARLVCAGRSLLKLEPYSAQHTVNEYRGGGVDGVGFGITQDVEGRIWVSNYGFKGTKCPIDPGSNSLSSFGLDGTPLSPPGGFTQGGIARGPGNGGGQEGEVMALDWPQGMGAGADGSVWVANCGNDTVTRYVDGDPTRSQNYSGGINKPFGVVVDDRGIAWVTSIGSDQVFAYHPDGRQVEGSPFSDRDMRRPLGIATDSAQTKWVANSVKIDLPCGQSGGASLADLIENATTPPSITMITEAGRTQSFTGGGLTIPWGIATDGDDNVWVADFGGKRVSVFCGSDAATCPVGMRTGDPLYRNGVPFDGLQRNTGVQIDQAGNVWLANNWKQIPIQSDPGGNGMVVMVGAAPPPTRMAGVAPTGR